MECARRTSLELTISQLEFDIKNSANAYVKSMLRERLERAKRSLEAHKKTCQICQGKGN